MKYLPILQELFESDTLAILLFGLVASLVAAVLIRKRKKLRIAFLCSALIYVLCEVLSSFHTNYLLELVLLFVGTAAIGCGIGFLIGLIKAKIFPSAAEKEK